MNFGRRIEFRVTTKSPLHIGYGRPSGVIDLPTLRHVPGTAIKGTLRDAFRLIYETDEEAELELFGGFSKPGAVLVSHLKIQGEPITEIQALTSMVSSYDTRKDKIKRYVESLVPGTILTGMIVFHEETPGLQISLACTALRSIGVSGVSAGGRGLGAMKSRGYGKCEVEIVGRQRVNRAFISYSWEDPEHNQWVAELVHKLDIEGIDTIFDRNSLDFARKPQRDVVEEFMTTGISHSDKIVVVLSPGFKRKCDTNVGGVGFESTAIKSEPKVDPVLSRVVTVLRNGAVQESLPSFLEGATLIDMRSGCVNNEYDRLVQMLT